MKQNILPALRLTLVCVFVFIVLYPLLIWVVAKAAPNHGNGETVLVNGKVVGYKLIGQSFTQDKYFWSRPSAVAYNAAGSGGSNKGPSNPEYLKTVQDRTDTFLVHNPGIRKAEIPSELVTASGSGLDPDISPEAAIIQVKRISTIRGIPEEKTRALVDAHIHKAVVGTSKINVLQLNIDLDKLSKP